MLGRQAPAGRVVALGQLRANTSRESGAPIVITRSAPAVLAIAVANRPSGPAPWILTFSRFSILPSLPNAVTTERGSPRPGWQWCGGRSSGPRRRRPEIATTSWIRPATSAHDRGSDAVAVTEKALALLHGVRADVVVAVGGGSTTGLAKALAVRTGVDQVVLPTTYAGSEVTPVLGETVDGRKTTRSDPSILPETVLYDVELSGNFRY
ncbi:iron-containing alcohol dehydrogenase [Pseudonocardia sp. GCM10023141]|uniref:iron-containing alcohol dehydrogenase n=1 Tax=Pseudonocardia sp. GCM10023141 TaxID=3252653 RepID=UPI00360A3653